VLRCNVAAIQLEQGDGEQAMAEYARAVSAAAQAFGPNHPWTAELEEERDAALRAAATDPTPPRW
jgi:hypothetical protein